jgi:hypothetical protein
MFEISFRVFYAPHLHHHLKNCWKANCSCMHVCVCQNFCFWTIQSVFINWCIMKINVKFVFSSIPLIFPWSLPLYVETINCPLLYFFIIFANAGSRAYNRILWVSSHKGRLTRTSNLVGIFVLTVDDTECKCYD